VTATSAGKIAQPGSNSTRTTRPKNPAPSNVVTNGGSQPIIRTVVEVGSAKVAADTSGEVVELSPTSPVDTEPPSPSTPPPQEAVSAITATTPATDRAPILPP
jgi:hypothetical protein